MSQPRLFLALFLSMGVLYVYYTKFAPPVPPAANQAVVSTSQNQPPTTGVTPTPNGSTSTTEISSLLPAQPLDDKGPVTVVQNDLSRISLSQTRAFLSHWVLKKFNQTVEKDSPLTDLLGEGGGILFTTGQADVDAKLIYTPKGDGEFLGQADTIEVLQKWITPSAEQPYLANLSVTIKNTGDQPMTVTPGTLITRFQKEQPKRSGGIFSMMGAQPDIFEPYLLENGALVHGGQWAKLAEKTEKTGSISWAGISDRYFLLSIISRQDSAVTTRYGKTPEGRIYTSLAYTPQILQAGESVEKKYSIYVGPKERDDLKKLNMGLEKSVDYGWFSAVAIGLLWLLKFFHSIIPNWGIAIILLTFFVKLLLHPVNVKAMTSMKAMQKIQPELKQIQEKYSKDRERLNTEMMALFKRHKVNPAGGCLPMILQMPIYIALYRVLFNAIELYHAPFFGFYKDLAAPDPYLISPIILGIMMALQQKLTPTANMDPAQQKMMIVMPLIFSVFMIFLPAGLVFYILANTVISVVQQYMIHRDITGMDLFKKYILRRA